MRCEPLDVSILVMYADMYDPRTLLPLVRRLCTHLAEWQDQWEPTALDSSHVGLDADQLEAALMPYLDRLTTGNYPFFHPSYAGQMLKPPHPAAVLGYWAAQLINPNNHALDGGPPTSAMEKEAVGALRAMVGFPQDTLGHLTSGGTVANLEALFVAREIHPEQPIGVAANAHYTHKRMSHVLRTDTAPLPTDVYGRIDPERLAPALDQHDIGTVVCTLGTTGLGLVDPLQRIVPICRAHGVRVHVDAAYGGFFRLASAPPLAEPDHAAFEAIAEADSVVIDPHKHGLQPYGCGAVLFRDPRVGRFYAHDSPYTYFTSDDLHLGEISLECSRAGAAAGALWCTLQAVPLQPTSGLGPIITACLKAAQMWATRMRDSSCCTVYTEPATDILTFFPVPDERTTEAVSARSQAVFEQAMQHDEPLYLSVYTVPVDQFTTLHPSYAASRSSEVTILRSVLMKPIHADAVDMLHKRLKQAIAATG